MNLTGENIFYSVMIENRKTHLIKIFTVKIQTACVVFFQGLFFFIDLKIYYRQKLKCNVRMSKILK